MSKTICELKHDLKYHEGYIKGLQEAFKMFEKVIKEGREKYDLPAKSSEVDR